VFLVVTRNAVFHGAGDVPSGSVIVVKPSDYSLVVGTCQFRSAHCSDLLDADQIQRLEDLLLCDTPLPALE